MATHHTAGQDQDKQGRQDLEHRLHHQSNWEDQE